MLNGREINQTYFQPKYPSNVGGGKGEGEKWTEVEKELLCQGLAKYGFNFSEIASELLPEWTPMELRIKCQRLVGRQSLEEYKRRDWRPENVEQIEAEYEENKRIGLELGQWKNNTLVNDDDGKVGEYLSSRRRRRTKAD